MKFFTTPNSKKLNAALRIVTIEKFGLTFFLLSHLLIIYFKQGLPKTNFKEVFEWYCAPRESISLPAKNTFKRL